jgi:hypothetical protein
MIPKITCNVFSILPLPIVLAIMMVLFAKNAKNSTDQIEMEIVLKMPFLDVRIMILPKNVPNVRKDISFLVEGYHVTNIPFQIVRFLMRILIGVWNVKKVFGKIWMEDVVDTQLNFVSKFPKNLISV